MQASNWVIQGLWVGGSLSRLEKLSIQSFLAYGHEYHLYAYTGLPGRLSSSRTRFRYAQWSRAFDVNSVP